MKACPRNYWYQEPWVWFNLLLLSTAIICASWMSILAIRHSPAEIGSRWYNDGALAKRERHQEALISAINLHGQLTFSANGSVTFFLQHDPVDQTQAVSREIDVHTLSLYIEHSTSPEFDQVIKLGKVSEFTYSGKLDKPMRGKRRLLISPASDRWYLTASGYFPASLPINLTPEMS